MGVSFSFKALHLRVEIGVYVVVCIVSPMFFSMCIYVYAIILQAELPILVLIIVDDLI